jgi:hypothetical protein
MPIMDPDVARQLRDTGLTDAEAHDLADLAAEVERLPEVKPPKGWLHESRWRLLRKFDDRPASRPSKVDPADS